VVKEQYIDYYGENLQVGDTVEFIMPPFCSGDYIYEVTSIGPDGPKFEGAPERIMDSCYEFRVIKRKESEECN